MGFSGSLQTLVDGTDYLVAGDGIIVNPQANGSIEIELDTSTKRLRLGSRKVLNST